MGCWNDTCAISHLPIMAGEKVRFLMLTQNPYHKNQEACYSTDFWQPRMLPIRAKYNDYGSIEDYDSQDPVIKIWQDQFQKDLVELPLGKNEYHDLPTSKNMPFEDFLKSLWEGRVKVYFDGLKFSDDGTFKSEKLILPICQAMIREDVYKLVFSLLSNNDDVNSVISELKEIIGKTKQEFKNSPLSSIPDTTNHYLFRELDNNILEYSYKRYPYSSTKRNILKWVSPNSMGEHEFRGNPSYTMSYLLNNNIDLDSKEAAHLIKELLEFSAVGSFMDRCRQAWHPQCGAGSQDQDWETYKKFHTSLLKIIDKKLEEK